MNHFATKVSTLGTWQNLKKVKCGLKITAQTNPAPPIKNSPQYIEPISASVRLIYGL